MTRMSKLKYSDLRYIARQTKGKASLFFYHAEDISKHFPKTKFLMVVRESTKQQNSGAQTFRLFAGLKKFTDNIINPDMPVAQVYSKGFSDSCLELIKYFALEYKAVPVAYCTDRWLRSKEFHPIDNFDDLPTNDELIDFVIKMYPVPVAVLLHPDTPRKKVLSAISTFEFNHCPPEWKDNSPGWRKRRRKSLRKLVMKLRRLGLSFNSISKRLNLSTRTVYNWCK